MRSILMLPRAGRFGMRRVTLSSAIPARLPAVAPLGLPTSYTTTFPTDENPINESGFWIQGGTVGLDWTNMKSLSGDAQASTINTGFNDNIAHLNPAKHAIPADHRVIGTISRAGGYAPTDSHECELLLRWLITANSARGYEVTFPFANSTQVQVVRWNGALNDFTVLTGTQTNGGNIADGDTLEARIIGSTITAFHNGVQVYTVTDTTWTTGNPGLGAFVRTTGVPASYCWKDFTAVPAP
jgi:hypothetical protein